MYEIDDAEDGWGVGGRVGMDVYASLKIDWMEGVKHEYCGAISQDMSDAICRGCHARPFFLHASTRGWYNACRI